MTNNNNVLNKFSTVTITTTNKELPLDSTKCNFHKLHLALSQPMHAIAIRRANSKIVGNVSTTYILCLSENVQNVTETVEKCGVKCQDMTLSEGIGASLALSVGITAEELLELVKDYLDDNEMEQLFGEKRDPRAISLRDKSLTVVKH